MVKFNPKITAYLLPGYDNKKICYWMSLLLKVEHISYTMGTCALPDIYTLAHGITIALTHTDTELEVALMLIHVLFHRLLVVSI